MAVSGRLALGVLLYIFLRGGKDEALCVKEIIMGSPGLKKDLVSQLIIAQCNEYLWAESVAVLVAGGVLTEEEIRNITHPLN